MGVIKNPRSVFKIAHREDLVAAYLGQTATKTLDLLKSCIGGVLFIDEVYSLGSGYQGKIPFPKKQSTRFADFCLKMPEKVYMHHRRIRKRRRSLFFQIEQRTKIKIPMGAQTGAVHP